MWANKTKTNAWLRESGKKVLGNWIYSDNKTTHIPSIALHLWLPYKRGKSSLPVSLCSCRLCSARHWTTLQWRFFSNTNRRFCSGTNWVFITITLHESQTPTAAGHENTWQLSTAQISLQGKTAWGLNTPPLTEQRLKQTLNHARMCHSPLYISQRLHHETLSCWMSVCITVISPDSICLRLCVFYILRHLADSFIHSSLHWPSRCSVCLMTHKCWHYLSSVIKS